MKSGSAVLEIDSGCSWLHGLKEIETSLTTLPPFSRYAKSWLLPLSAWARIHDGREALIDTVSAVVPSSMRSTEPVPSAPRTTSVVCVPFGKWAVPAVIVSVATVFGLPLTRTVRVVPAQVGSSPPWMVSDQVAGLTAPELACAAASSWSARASAAMRSALPDGADVVGRRRSGS